MTLKQVRDRQTARIANRERQPELRAALARRRAANTPWPQITLDQAFQIVLNIAKSQVSDKSPTCLYAVQMVTGYYQQNIED